MSKLAFTYLLKCADGSLYAGWTFDPAARLAAHNSGTGAKYTRARRPVALAYLEPCDDKRAAMQREAALKRMTRAQKLALVDGAFSSGKSTVEHQSDASLINPPL